MNFSNLTKRHGLIALLVALNLVVLSVLFFNRRPHRRGPDTEGLFKRELQLSDEQAARFRDLRKTYFEQSRPLHESMREGRRNMIESLGAMPPDTLAFQRQSSENAAIQARLDALLARHFLELKAVCNPEQQQKFNEAFMRATRVQRGSLLKKR
jgi:protein CpxP